MSGPFLYLRSCLYLYLLLFLPVSNLNLLLSLPVFSTSSANGTFFAFNYFIEVTEEL